MHRYGDRLCRAGFVRWSLVKDQPNDYLSSPYVVCLNQQVVSNNEEHYTERTIRLLQDEDFGEESVTDLRFARTLWKE